VKKKKKKKKKSKCRSRQLPKIFMNVSI
jgi:hypothetical protein